MQSFSKEKENVLAELKTMQPKQTKEGGAMASAMDAGHKPTMIFSSQHPKRGHKSQSEALYFTRGAPNETKSRWNSKIDYMRSSSASNLSSERFNVGNQDLRHVGIPEERPKPFGVLILSSEAHRSKSSSPNRPFILNTRPSALSLAKPKSREIATGSNERTSPDSTSWKESRKRASPPPLIPPPTSFTKRHGSVSSESFSSPSSTPQTSPRSPPFVRQASFVDRRLLPPPPPPPTLSTLQNPGNISPEITRSSTCISPVSSPTTITRPPPPPPPSPPPKLLHQYTTPSGLSKQNQRISRAAPPPPPPPPLDQQESYVDLQIPDPLLPLPLALTKSNLYQNDEPCNEKTLQTTTKQFSFSESFQEVKDTSKTSIKQCSVPKSSKDEVIEENDFIPETQNDQVCHTPLTVQTVNPTPQISPLSSRPRDQARGGHNAGEVNLSPPDAVGENSGTAQSESPSGTLTSYYCAVSNGQGTCSDFINHEKKENSSDYIQDEQKQNSLDFIQEEQKQNSSDFIQDEQKQNSLDFIQDDQKENSSDFIEGWQKPVPLDITSNYSEGEFIDDVFSSILSQETREPETTAMSTVSTDTLCGEKIHTQPPLQIEILENLNPNNRIYGASLSPETADNRISVDNDQSHSFSLYELPPANEGSQDLVAKLDQEALAAVSLSSDNDETKDVQSDLPRDTTQLYSIQKLSPPRRGRTRKRDVRPLKVTKLRPNVKTVREHIKKGTVDELATLFSQEHLVHPLSSNLPSEHLGSDTSHESLHIDTDDQNGYQSHDRIMVFEKPQSAENTETVCPENENLDVPEYKPTCLGSGEIEKPLVEESLLVTDKTLHSYKEPDVPIEISENETDVKATKHSKLSGEQEEGFDYLNASREIFKQVMRSDSKSPRNSLRKANPKRKANTVYSREHKTPHTGETSEHKPFEVEIAENTGSGSEEELYRTKLHGMREELARPASDHRQDSSPNTDDILKKSKQSEHTPVAPTRNTGAVLTSSYKPLVPEPISSHYVNSTHTEENSISQPALFSTPSENVIETGDNFEKHVSRIGDLGEAFTSHRQNTATKEQNELNHPTKDDLTSDYGEETVLKVQVAKTVYGYDSTNINETAGDVEGSFVETGSGEKSGFNHEFELTSLSPLYNANTVSVDNITIEKEFRTDPFSPALNLWESGSTEQLTGSARKSINTGSWTTTQTFDAKTGEATTSLPTEATTTSNNFDVGNANVDTELETGRLSRERANSQENKATNWLSLTKPSNGGLEFNSSFKSEPKTLNEDTHKDIDMHLDIGEIIKDRGDRESFPLLSSSFDSDHVAQSVSEEGETSQQRPVVLHNFEGPLEESPSLQTHRANNTSLLAHSALEFENEEDEGDRLERDGERAHLPEFRHSDRREENVREQGLPLAQTEVVSVETRHSQLEQSREQSQQLSKFRKLSTDNSGNSTWSTTKTTADETSDNFLSILDSIELDGHSDFSSEFADKSVLHRVHSGERSRSSSLEKSDPLLGSTNVIQDQREVETNQSTIISEKVYTGNGDTPNSSELKSRLSDTSESESEEEKSYTVNKILEPETNSKSSTVATSTTTTKNTRGGISVGDKVGSLEDELHLLHTNLSPQVSEHAVEEKLLPQAPEDDNISNLGSVSSRASNSGKLRETVFNSAFFTSGALITEGDEIPSDLTKEELSDCVISENKTDSRNSEDLYFTTLRDTTHIEESSDLSRNSSVSSTKVKRLENDKERKSSEISTSSHNIHKIDDTYVITKSTQNEKLHPRPENTAINSDRTSAPKPPSVFSETTQRQTSVDLEENLITRDQFIATKNIFEKSFDTAPSKETRFAKKQTSLCNLSKTQATTGAPSYEASHSSLNSGPHSSAVVSNNTESFSIDLRDRQSSTFRDTLHQVEEKGTAVTHERPNGHSPHPSPPLDLSTTPSIAVLRQRQGYLDSDLYQEKHPASSFGGSGSINNDLLYSENTERHASIKAVNGVSRKRAESTSSSDSPCSDESDRELAYQRDKYSKKEELHSPLIFQRSDLHKDYFSNRAREETSKTTSQFPFASDAVNKQSSSLNDNTNFEDVIDVISGFNDATTSYTKENNISKDNSNKNHYTENRTDPNGNMSAMVGELSTFSIHHKSLTSEDKSMSMTSDTSSNQYTPRTNGVVMKNGVDHDIYLIQDNNGDYYALQEVDGKSTPVGSNVTAHIINSGNVSSQKNKLVHSKYQGSVSTASPNSSRSSSIDYLLTSSAQQQEGSNLIVDGTAVDEDKAREVISTFLESQENLPQAKRYETENISFSGHYGSSSVEHHGALKQVHTQGDITADTGERLHYTQQPQAFSGSRGNIFIFDPRIQSNDLTNSTVTIQNDTNTRVDNSQVWTAPGFEPYITGSGAQDHHSSSVHITNRNTPHQKMKVNHSNTPDKSWSESGEAVSSYSQPVAINSQQNVAGQGIAPFQTTPISITTTTQAVVGETVDMQIEFPDQLQPKHRIYQRQVSTTTEDTSGDESVSQRYVVKSSPKKSSLKKVSKYDSSSLNDSASDVVYTKKETVSADVNIGGKTREIVLHPINDPNDDLGSSEGNLYQVYNSGKPKPSQEFQTNRAHRQQQQDMNYAFTSRTNYERPSRNLPRSYSEHNLFDGQSSTEKARGRAKHRFYSPREGRGPGSDTGKAYKIKQGKLPHSPERFFKNPTLSVPRDYSDLDDFDSSRGYHSEIDITQPKRYKTITKVVVDGDENRSRSSSPASMNRYRVANSQRSSSYNSREEMEERQGQTRYRVLHNNKGVSPDIDNDFKENHRRYRVFGQSDSALNFAGRQGLSSHEDLAHNKSLDEATIIRTSRVQPSRISSQPRMGKSHKTTIQLEVDKDKRIRKTHSQNDVNQAETRYSVKHSRSFDDALSPTIVPVNNASPPSPHASPEKSWRINGVGSESADSDYHMSDSQDYDHPAVRTMQQKSGNKRYVVQSTVGEPHDDRGNIVHLPGWHKSTIDINEDHPQRLESAKNYKIFNRSLDEEMLNSESYKTEKSVYFVRQVSDNAVSQNKLSQRSQTTEFVSPDSGQGTEVASSDGENDAVRQKFERVERIYEVRTEPQMPEHLTSTEDLSNDLRVLRGKILIQNRLDESEHGDDDFDENANLFDTSFHLGKDNPLYSSDQDLMDSLRREEEREMAQQVTQDITYEHVERIAQRHKQSDGQVKLSPKPRRKQNLSTLLLSKIASVDSKDIRQTIDVEHHNEEIYGDIDFIHANGARTSSRDTRNFDSVNENVELTLTQGKAYVIIKVIAERIVPTDYEFNVWRKSQAIVTRCIEIDLLANEQRRRLYKDVMNSAEASGSLEYGRSGGRGHHSQDGMTPQERQLSSMETLRLFSQILDVADGQGDSDHTDMRTKQEMGQLAGPEMDLLY